MRPPRLHGCLANLIGLIVVCLVIVYGVAAITAPWAFHIAGRTTPLLYWSATGTLRTSDGAYPLYIFFYPGSSFSRLRLDGLRPTGGVKGTGAFCKAPGNILQLKLSGTIYNGWSSTQDSVMSFRLLERRGFFDSGTNRGYFDLSGRWRGEQLVMDDRRSQGTTYRWGLKMENKSVILSPGSYADFEAACANASAAPQ